jgi:hypothetical protein
METSNRATIEAMTEVTTCGLPLSKPTGLADAGSSLPLQRWLDGE